VGPFAVREEVMVVEDLSESSLVSHHHRSLSETTLSV
jgi:hypothetical protein